MLFVAGMLYRLDGLYEKALEKYDRLLESEPDATSCSWRYNRARIFTYQGRYEDAIRRAGAGRAQVEPEHPLVKTFLAVALLQPGTGGRGPGPRSRRSCARTRTSTASSPCSAWCLSARGEHEEARALITDRVKDVAAADHDIAFWLASFYAMEGMVDEGVEWVRRAVRLGNENYPLFAQQRTSSTACAATRASRRCWRS